MLFTDFCHEVAQCIHWISLLLKKKLVIKKKVVLKKNGKVTQLKVATTKQLFTTCHVKRKDCVHIKTSIVLKQNPGPDRGPERNGTPKNGLLEKPDLKNWKRCYLSQVIWKWFMCWSDSFSYKKRGVPTSSPEQF